MNRKPITIRLSTTEAAIYDSRDDVRTAELRRDVDARAHEILDAGDVSSVTFLHPQGFVAFYTEARRPSFGWYR
jgi:hypothetical protein